MTAIKNLPTRLLRHIAKHPNTTIDSSFVNTKPANATAKRQAEIDLMEALHYLWERGDITNKPSDQPEYRGKLTYNGLEKIDIPRQIVFWSIITTVREIIVFSIGTAIGLIAGSAGTLLLQSVFPLLRLASP
jgi:hypothetical protein